MVLLPRCGAARGARADWRARAPLSTALHVPRDTKMCREEKVSAVTGAYQPRALGSGRAGGGGWQAGQLLFPVRGSGRAFYFIMKKAL